MLTSYWPAAPAAADQLRPARHLRAGLVHRLLHQTRLPPQAEVRAPGPAPGARLAETMYV